MEAQEQVLTLSIQCDKMLKTNKELAMKLNQANESLRKLQADNSNLATERSQLTKKFHVLTSEMATLQALANAIKSKECSKPLSSKFTSFDQFPDFGGNNISKIESLHNTQKLLVDVDEKELKSKRSNQTQINAFNEICSPAETDVKAQLDLLSDALES